MLASPWQSTWFYVCVSVAASCLMWLGGWPSAQTLFSHLLQEAGRGLEIVFSQKRYALKESYMNNTGQDY